MPIISDSYGDKVMIFIDLRNMNNAVRMDRPHSRLDFIRMVKTLCGDRSLKRAYVFDGMDSVENCRQSRGFHDMLRYHGFTVVLTDSYDPELNRQKGVDVEMACKVMHHGFKNDYDTAIIVSGDSDFVPLVKELKDMGKKVEVAAFDKSCSEKMRLVADAFHRMEVMPLLEMESESDEVNMTRSTEAFVEVA